MARTDRFYIGMVDGSSGMDTSLKPFIIPDNAFQSLSNAYVFRGRVRKRFGSRLMQGSTTPSAGYEQLQSRVRVLVNTTDGAGVAGGTVPGAVFEVGQMFSIGNQIFTVQTPGVNVVMANTGAGAGVYSTTNGIYAFNGVPALTAVYFYPSQPIMGLITYEVPAVSNELLFAFDTQFAYQFTTTGWERLETAIWTGDDTNFFWGATWRGVSASDNYLFVTNYKNPVPPATVAISDPMYFWNGNAWTAFSPVYDSVSGGIIVTARIILPFRNRLILLNTIESADGTNTLSFVNRVRFSWIGDPTNTVAFYDNVDGRGDFLDAPTKEAIITAQFLKDHLIVYFESSTWELVSTGNEVLPFRWQQINTELGAESTFSQVPFDKFVLGVGNVGIHACNGSNVERIDDKIPDTVFEIHNADNGIERVYGIRDYEVEMVYWSFPNTTRRPDFPFNNRILVYNYKTGSWAINDDSITAFGYYQDAANEGETWQSDLGTWEDDNTTWFDGLSVQSREKAVVGGNQEGFTFVIDPDENRNSPALQITNMTVSGSLLTVTSINHNLQQGSNGYGDYIAFENVQGITGINGLIFPVSNPITTDTFTIELGSTVLSGSYIGGGTIARVSNIIILTKQYNFYAQDGYDASINKVDFLVDKTQDGAITVDYYVSSTTLSTLSNGAASGSLLGNGVLETSPYLTYVQIGTTDALGSATGTTSGTIGTKFQIYDQLFIVTTATGALTTAGTGSGTFDTTTGAYTFTGVTPLFAISKGEYLIPLETVQERLWHPVYPMSNGEYIQLNIYMTDAQLRNSLIAWSDFELHAMMFFAQKCSSRLQ